MDNHPEQVKEIHSIEGETFVLFSGEKLYDPESEYFGYGNRIFPNLEKYTEKSDGGDITVDLSKSKNLKEVILFGFIIKGKTAKALQNAKVYLYGIRKENYSKIKKLFPNSKITFDEENTAMVIKPKVKHTRALSKPKTIKDKKITIKAYGQRQTVCYEGYKMTKNGKCIKDKQYKTIVVPVETLMTGDLISFEEVAKVPSVKNRKL